MQRRTIDKQSAIRTIAFNEYILKRDADMSVSSPNHTDTLDTLDRLFDGQLTPEEQADAERILATHGWNPDRHAATINAAYKRWERDYNERFRALVSLNQEDAS